MKINKHFSPEGLGYDHYLEEALEPAPRIALVEQMVEKTKPGFELLARIYVLPWKKHVERAPISRHLVTLLPHRGTQEKATCRR
jgi:hypothetical protein